jgi:hypothetical protein
VVALRLNLAARYGGSNGYRNVDPGLRDKQKTEALMEIAETLEAMRQDIARIRSDIKAIATKIK